MNAVAEGPRGGAGLFQSMPRNIAVQPLGKNASALRVFEPVEKNAKNAKARRNDSAGIAGVHSFVENFDSEIADDRSAERCRQPKLIVISASAVKADYQSWSSDPFAEQVDVRGQIG